MLEKAESEEAFMKRKMVAIDVYKRQQLERVRPVDQFCHTSHVETVVLMSKVNPCLLYTSGISLDGG